MNTVNVKLEKRKRSWFPMGSVVILDQGNKALMIIGRAQLTKVDDSTVMYDYAAVPYPEGFLGGDKVFLFDEPQIREVLVEGPHSKMDDELIEALNKKLEEAIANAEQK